MNQRDRVIAALEHRDPGPLPYDFGCAKELAARIAAEGVTLPGREGLCVRCAEYHGQCGWVKPGYWRDGWGVVWNRTGADRDIGVIDNPILSEPDMSLLKVPEIDISAANDVFAKAAADKGDRFLFAEIGFSLFERAWTLCGMEDLLYYMAAEPEFVDELMKAITARNLALMDIAFAHGVDGFHFGDDWGAQQGLIMGPKHWKRFVAPHAAAMIQKARSNGLYTSLHSCGDLSSLLDDLVEMGLQCYQTFQPEIYPPAAFKRRYGGRLAVWGGVSTQRLLPWATPEKVYQTTREIMDTVGRGGGLIIAPTHTMTPDIPTANILAMIRAMQEG